MISTLCTLNLDAASVALVHSECQQCKSGLSSIPQCTFWFGPSFFFFLWMLLTLTSSFDPALVNSWAPSVDDFTIPHSVASLVRWTLCYPSCLWELKPSVCFQILAPVTWSWGTCFTSLFLFTICKTGIESTLWFKSSVWKLVSLCELYSVSSGHLVNNPVLFFRETRRKFFLKVHDSII